MRRDLSRSLALAACLAAPFPASALDCAKASDDVEKALCANADAKKADDAMVAAFGALKAKLPRPAAASLVAAQKSWIERRGYTCDTSAPDGASCLVTFTDARTAWLEGRPQAGTYPAGAFEPLLQSRSPKRKGDWDIAVGLLKFHAPKTAAERAFNKAVDAIAADTPLNDDPDPDVQGLSYDAGLEVTYASDRLIAAEVTIDRYDGGAHPSSGTTHITIDGKSGRNVVFDDVFANEQSEEATKLCEQQIVGQRKEKGAEQDNGSASAEGFEPVGKAFREMDGWRFGATETTVVFDPYVIGSYAEGPYSCSFKNDDLRKLVKPDFPLP